MSQRFDLIVIGGGAAGLTASREAARRRASVCLVQNGPLGGDCTFTGCVPSKTLLAAADRGESFQDAMATVRSVVARIAATEDDEVLRGEGVNVVHGRAVFRSPDELDVGGDRLHAERIIVATGARPAVPPIEGLAGAGFLTNETVFSLAAQPRRLAVLGGGAIGCELGQAFAGLGSAVTVLEADPRVLPVEEPEASEVVAGALADHGVTIRTANRLQQVERLNGGGLCLHLASGETMEADELLVAVGREPSTDGLGLEEIGVDPGDLALVAVHAWDVHGAHRAGLTTGWASRLEGTFAAVFDSPDVSGADLVEVVDALLALDNG